MALALPTARGSESLTDAEAVMRLVAGDAAAFAWLVQRYERNMLRVALRHVRSRAVAQEVVQETWLSVVRGIGRFEGRSSLKNWLFRILTNRAKTRSVRERRTVPLSALGADGDEPTELDRLGPDGFWLRPRQDWRDDSECVMLRAELSGAVSEALTELPHRQAEVVRLRHLEGCSSAEVCERLAISEANQRVLLHRGRAKLRRLLGTGALDGLAS